MSYGLMTEAEARVKMHEPEPTGSAYPRTMQCPCGYTEVCQPEWRPYLKSSGWVPAWCYSLKCPDHGWASKVYGAGKRPAFKVTPRPEEDDIL